jgi:heavy metal sensor kinase
MLLSMGVMAAVTVIQAGAMLIWAWHTVSDLMDDNFEILAQHFMLELERQGAEYEFILPESRDEFLNKNGVMVTLFRHDGTVVNSWLGSFTYPGYEKCSQTGMEQDWTTIPGTRFRERKIHVVLDGEEFCLAIVYNLDRFILHRAQMMRHLIFSSLIFIIVAGWVGYGVAHNSLSSVSRIAQEARNISIQNLERRLPQESLPQEIQDISIELNQMLERLEQSVAALSDFTSFISHEVRTPLAIIRSVGESTLQKARTTEKYQESLGSILEEVDRLSVLVEHMLYLARLDSGRVELKKGDIKLSELVDECIDLYSPLAEENGQLLVSRTKETCRITADMESVRRAVRNLVDNAIKYAPPGAEIKVGCDCGKQQTVLYVEDDGEPVPEEVAARLFDRFTRGDKPGESRLRGAGLGLAIVKWVAEIHGGTAGYVYVEGRGNRFEVVFPNS